MGIALAPDYAVSRLPLPGLRLRHAEGNGRPDPAVSRRRRFARGPHGHPRGDPRGPLSRRLPAAVRARRQALRHDRGRHGPGDRPGPEVARRQDAAPRARRLDSAGQPLSRLARVLLRASQLPGPRLAARRPGLQYQTEHGPSGFDGPGGGDEVNLVEAGKNYGWPVVHHRASAAGMVSPVLEYTPAVAPSGASFARGAAMPSFAGDFFFATLRGERLIRVRFDPGGPPAGRRDGGALSPDVYGRLRDVIFGPDGALYVATSNRDGRGRPRPGDDRILRVVESGPVH